MCTGWQQKQSHFSFIRSYVQIHIIALSLFLHPSEPALLASQNDSIFSPSALNPSSCLRVSLIFSTCVWFDCCLVLTDLKRRSGGSSDVNHDDVGSSLMLLLSVWTSLLAATVLLHSLAPISDPWSSRLVVVHHTREWDIDTRLFLFYSEKPSSFLVIWILMEQKPISPRDTYTHTEKTVGSNEPDDVCVWQHLTRWYGIQ